MKKNVLFLIILFFVGESIYAQVSKDKALGEFSKLVVIGRYDTDVKQSDRFHVRYVYEDEEVEEDKIEFSYSDEELTIRYKGGAFNDYDLKFVVEVPSLDYIEAKHGATIRVSENFDFNNKPLELQSKSGGKIRCSVAETPYLIAGVNKGGSVRVTGKAVKAKYEISAGGTIGAVGLEAKIVDAKVSMGGEIMCYASELLNAKVTSGGTISYKGDAKVKEKVRLGGDIRILRK